MGPFFPETRFQRVSVSWPVFIYVLAQPPIRGPQLGSFLFCLGDSIEPLPAAWAIANLTNHQGGYRPWRRARDRGPGPETLRHLQRLPGLWRPRSHSSPTALRNENIGPPGRRPVVYQRGSRGMSAGKPGGGSFNTHCHAGIAVVCTASMFRKLEGG